MLGREKSEALRGTIQQKANGSGTLVQDVFWEYLPEETRQEKERDDNSTQFKAHQWLTQSAGLVIYNANPIFQRFTFFTTAGGIGDWRQSRDLLSYDAP